MRAALTIYRVLAIAAVLHLGSSCLCGQAAHAQSDRLALKNGESTELHPVYWVANCRSVMIGIPEVEIMEGPPEVTLSVKAGMVLPRRFNCAKEVPGGKLVLTTSGITDRKDAQLIYRLKYKTKDGERQTSHTYRLSLFP
jgi:hypothetical protein